MSESSNGSPAGASDWEQRGASPASAGGLGVDDAEAEPFTMLKGATRCIRSAYKASREQIPALPEVDKTAVKAAAREALRSGKVAETLKAVAALARHQWNVETKGKGGQLAELRSRLTVHDAALAKLTRVTERAIARGPQEIDVPGGKQPWSWLSAIWIPVLILTCAFALYLGWNCVRFLVANSGVLPIDQTWVISSGAIFSVCGLELVLTTLLTHGQKKAYLRALLVGGITSWTFWVVTFAWLFGRALYASAQLGAEQQGDNNPLLGIIQIATQLAGEILVSASCLIAIDVICQTHAGVRSAVHPERRRRASLLVRISKVQASVHSVMARLKAKLDHLNAAGAILEQRTCDEFRTHLRQLQTEVYDLFQNSEMPKVDQSSSDSPERPAGT